MTREEQLQRESEVYAWTANQFDIKLAFIKGAEWADRCPNPDTIRKVFNFALNKTNLLIADSLGDVDWEELVKKAMKE